MTLSFDKVAASFLTYSDFFRLGSNHRLGAGTFYEFIIQAAYESLLNEGDIAFDCGLYRGRHAIPLSRAVGHSGRVIAFEANPDRASAFVRNFSGKYFSNISVIAKALASQPGILCFNLVTRDLGWSGLRVLDSLPSALLSSVEKIQVPATTLDQEVGYLPVRFIKMDLEGGEYDALSGSVSLLSTAKPVIIFENNRQDSASAYGYSVDQWFGLFESLSYSVYDVFGRKFTREDWHSPGIPWYFVAVYSGSPDDVLFVETKLPRLVKRVYRRLHFLSLVPGLRLIYLSLSKIRVPFLYVASLIRAS